VPIHSRFLVHWTGGDFHPAYAPITGAIRTLYAERLKDDCRNGLLMNKGRERIHGRNGAWIEAIISRVCFTEIRLSQARRHANQYGRLGIGFDRDWVVQRFGNPVLYVQNADTGVVVETLDLVRGYLADDPQKVKTLEIALGFVKKMSHQNCDDFEHYDEMEWRILQIDHMIPRYIRPQDPSAGLYRVLVASSDVRLLVFPDDETRRLATSDAFLSDFFAEGWPITVTVEECADF